MLLRALNQVSCRYAQLAEAEHEDANAAEALGDFQRFPTWFVCRTFRPVKLTSPDLCFSAFADYCVSRLAS